METRVATLSDAEMMSGIITKNEVFELIERCDNYQEMLFGAGCENGMMD